MRIARPWQIVYKKLMIWLRQSERANKRLGEPSRGLAKDLQEPIQKEAGTDGEDETDPAPAATNWDILESALARTSSIGTHWPWLRRIPEEEESNVKDSVTLGLPLKQPKADAEAS